MAEPDEALAFLNAFTELATRLVADRVVIHSLTYRSESFGSWDCEAGRRRIRVRVSWDGKDRHLVVARAELASGSKDRQWQLVEDHDLRHRRPTLVELFGTVHAAITAQAGV